MVIWSHARQSFAKHIAYQSGRTLAALAIMDGKRRPLSWVWGHIWKGLIDEFQDQGISNKVAADIMGCTLRTYQRRFSEYTEPCDEVGLNIWFRIYDALKTPLSADQVIVKFHHYKKREILSILSDMAKSNWIERDEQDRYCKVESYETWDLEMLCEYVHAYNHLSGKQNCTPEEFEQHTGLPRDAWQVAIDRISEQEIEQDVWYDVNREEFVLEGLGAMPGRFEGRVTPVLVLGGQEEIGRGMVIDFTVKPTRQIVYVRFLPGFETGLERFGLRNTSPGIKRRILEVIRRDYQDFNVEVVEQPPEDSTRYMTLEIGGVDPTGMNLLGYDNSFNGVPKDTGNLFLEDYLGGYNLPGKDASFSPYGGVFVDSLVIFSPEISAPMGSVHPLFDEIMSPVMPELGGNRVMASEWPVTEGSSDRTRAIEGAIRLVGTIVGNTATHEIGHSLGLPYVEGEKADSIRYHNLGGDKEYIMDAGSDRPFEERAELEGRGPAKFSPENQAYLQRILPR